MKKVMFAFVLMLQFHAVLTAQAAEKLRVCATVPELGSLVREVGGDRVEVTVFAKGTEDAHFVDAKPSFITVLSKADVLVAIGMELEIGWLPVLQQNARNAAVLSGAAGFIDASKAITPIEVPSGIIDRAMGDVHPAGNPHYLLDPLNGLRVAALLRDRMAALRPDDQKAFAAGYDQFASKLGAALFGEKLLQKYPLDKVMILESHHKLAEFLAQQKQQALLGGWLQAVQKRQGTKVVVDHNMWPYFADRFGLVIVGSLEPKPGVQPTTRHLKALVDSMKAQHVGLILTASYYDPRHARFVAENAGAKALAMAHQVGSRPGTNDYLSMINYDIQQLGSAL